MHSLQRIYLDNAATSWPKPEAVYQAIERYSREIGAPAGRSAYAQAGQAERIIAEARGNVARLLGVSEAKHVVFAFNGTDALNLAVHGLLEPGDHVLTTVAEHNSVLRPLRHWRQQGEVQVSYVDCDAAGIVDPDAVRRALRPNTKLVAVVHASNVTGAIQPIAEIGALLRDSSALFLVDGAQTLGHLPFAFADLNCDLLAASGHKGLLGPLGTGILVLGGGVESRLRSIRQGGTGTRSEDDRQPESLPDRYESGNHNVLGLAGLAAGTGYLLERGLDDIRRHDVELCKQLIAGLDGISGVRVFGPREAACRVGVVSITVDGYEPQEAALALDTAYRVQVRAGLHCAPRMHAALGTLAGGGTLRFSPGPFNTEADIEQAVRAIRELASASLAV